MVFFLFWCERDLLWCCLKFCAFRVTELVWFRVVLLFVRCFWILISRVVLIEVLMSLMRIVLRNLYFVLIVVVLSGLMWVRCFFLFIFIILNLVGCFFFWFMVFLCFNVCRVDGVMVWMLRECGVWLLVCRRLVLVMLIILIIRVMELVLWYGIGF